jgi:hypothetical protein
LSTIVCLFYNFLFQLHVYCDDQIYKWKESGVPVDGFSYFSLIFSFIFSPAIINVLRHLPIAVGRLSVCYRYLSFLSTYKSDHHNIHVAEKENCKKDKQWLTTVTPLFKWSIFDLF